eukprot:Opistho-2@10094
MIGANGIRRRSKRALLSRIFGCTSSQSDDIDTVLSSSTTGGASEHSRRVKCTRTDTNVGVITLGSHVTGESTTVFKPTTGEAIMCGKCAAIMTSFSKPIRNMNGQLNWECEFCGTVNKPDAWDEEIPRAAALSFELAGATVTGDIKTSPTSAPRKSVGLVVFCVDTSGSMAVTTEIPQLQLEWKRLRGSGGSSTRDFISRLKCVQTAVQRQIERIAAQDPLTRIALVTFGSEVTCFMDAMEEHVFAGDKLSDRNLLIEKGRELAKSLAPVKLTQTLLLERLRALEERGGTALGPALAIAAGMCAAAGGGEVFVCSDGLPNIALGAVSDADTAHGSSATDQEARRFYESMGAFAAENGTSISVIGLEGTGGCGLEYLRGCARATSGTVTLLHPLELVRQIRVISQNPVVATGADITIIAPAGISAEIVGRGSAGKATVHMANVNASTDIAVRSHVPDMPRVSPGSELPFQVQMAYTRCKDGARVMNVVTHTLRITRSRSAAEETCNVAVVSLACVQQAASIAEKGNYDDAQRVLACTERILSRSAKSDRQQEEFYILAAEGAALDAEIARCRTGGKAGDSAAKEFAALREAPLTMFLSGAAKKEAVKRRMAAAAAQPELSAQYYAYRFDV